MQDKFLRNHEHNVERKMRISQLATMTTRGIKFVRPFNIMSPDPKFSTPIILAGPGERVNPRTAIQRVLARFL